ncbi:MAG TPA: Calx-beta domain-containing protein [Thermoanaerobaculia bacterium]|jgi:uncharacterized repeat protein (TIGR01451 family)|nr:Calx-beta domain-containing protein [Thermoanaerobaculia bacterium]
MRFRGLLFLVLSFALSASASAQQACPDRPAPVPGEQLGCSVAASGDVIAYGANLGNRVLVSQGKGFQSLTASDGAPGDQFGFSIAIDGDTMAVGAPTADGPGGPDSGAAYVFRKQEGKWVQEAKLTAGDGAPGAQLGFSAALRNGTLAVGAAKDGARGSLSGAVYVFERTGTTWTQRAKLTGARTRAFDELGAAVALDGGVLVAGAPFEDGRVGGNQGGVHLFEQRGGAWTETGTLTPSGAAPGDELGFAVSIQGDTVAAGARRADVDGRVDAGWVEVFKRDGGGWRESARLTAGASAQAGELFGGAVALSGDRLLVGASQADGSHGATYLFEETAPGAWTLLGRMKPPDDQGPGRFGFAVAMSGATVVAGGFMANGGAGFVTCGTVPIQPQEAAPRLRISDVSLAEGNSATKPFAFTVSLSSPAGTGGVTFDIATSPGTARAGTDYVTRRLTRQTIPAGSSTYTFNVLVKGDILTKPNKTFFVDVTNVIGADIADGRGLGTILNDDAPSQPSLAIGDVSLNEGNGGTTAFPFTVQLSAAAPVGGVKFDIATSPGTATASTDYVPKSLTRQTIPAGRSSYTFQVLVKGDTSPEANETFFVKVSHVTGAIVTGSGQGQGTIRNDDQVADSADLSVTKVDTPDPVPAGDDLTYTITVTNAGPNSAASVSLIDTLPAGTTFVSLSSPVGWSCTSPSVGSGGTVSCSSPSLAVGSAVFTLAVAVAQSIPAGTVFSNTATASTVTPDSNPGNESGTAMTTVVDAADLSVAKVDTPDPVTAGNNLTYTITVTNVGPSSAASVSLGDTLPAGTTFVSLSSPSGWTCTKPPVGSGGTVSCSNPSLAVASAVFTLTVMVDPLTPSGTILTNTATASSTTADPNPGNESGTATTTVATLAASADLSVTKVDTPDPVTAGANLTYTITVTNAGPNWAASVSLSDTLPVGTTFVSLSSPAGWSCTTPSVGSGGTVSCSNASLALGVAIFTLTVAVDPLTPNGTVLTNTAAASSSTTDPNPGNESDSTTTTVIAITASADLSVTKVDTPDPVPAGGNLTYTMTVTNAGPNPAVSVSLSDTLPAGTTFVSLSSPGSWSCITPAVGLGGSVSCTNASLAMGSAVFTLAVAVTPSTPPGTILTNTVTIASATADPNSGDNTATTSTTVTTLILICGTKSVSGIFISGTAVGYTVVLTNNGPSTQADDPASDEFTDVLPSGLVLFTATATSGTATANTGTNTVHWNGSLPAGGSVTITIGATISGAVGSTITNQGMINYDTNGDGVNDASTLTNPASFQVHSAVQEDSIASIPTLSSVGLSLLILLLAFGGMAMLRRRRD